MDDRELDKRLTNIEETLQDLVEILTENDTYNDNDIIRTNDYIAKEKQEE